MIAESVQKLTEAFQHGSESEESLRAMIEAVPIAVYTTDAHGRLTFFNQAAVKLSGRVPELNTDQWCVTWKIFLPDGTPLPHDQCPMAMALKRGEVVSGGECIAERPDGTRFWFSPYPAVLRDGQGRITGGINMLVDITARKVAELQSAEQFRAMFDTNPGCVKLVARNGTLLQMNAAGLAMVGASSPEAVIGRSVYDLVAPEDRDRFREFNEKICREETGALEFDLVGLAGVRRRMETHAAPLHYSDGTTVQLALTQDITERKRGERAALLLSAIVDSSDDAIISKDLNGIITSWNKAAERLFGYSADEVVGKFVTILIPSDRLEEEPKILARLRRGERVDHFETVRRRKDGALLDISLTISPVKDSAGWIIGASKIARDITERERGERAGLLLSAIVDSSDDAIISKDLNGIITSWNKAAERLFGYSADEVVGKSVTILIPPDRLEEEPKILARLRRGERVDHFETVRRRKDGALLDISLTISPVRDSAGTIIGASKIARDISERKRAERAIEALNAELTADVSALSRMQQLSTRLVQADNFSELLDQILAAGIEITGADMGNIQLIENGALTIVAQRGFEQPFLSFFNSVHGGEAACGTALQRGERVVVENVAESPIFAGSPARDVMLAAGAYAVQSSPLVSRSGQVLGMFSTHYRAPRRPTARELGLVDVLSRQAADLIERKRAEAALIASESNFRQLADAMPQIVWTARADGYLDYYNERWYEFTGCPRDSFGDTSWEPILHPDDLTRSRETWYGAVRSGEAYTIEHRFWDRHERRWRWFMGRALPVRDAGGTIVKWFGTSTDIDEQKRVEDELRRANQDLEQFAFSASHDLQEPLRSVKIYSELLAKRYGERLDGRALEFMGYLRSGATRMETLVRDLLAYTQVDKLDQPGETADLNEALQTALANLSGAELESGAQVTAEPLPSARVHTTHAQQLFQNLIGNALKYRSPDRQTSIRISAERQDENWILSVADNGIGIDPQYKERIFGLFKRLHSSDEYAGTGIGLAICQRIVDRYHGRIWVESAPGQGSTFRFTLPV